MENILNENLPLDLPLSDSSIIKIIGVGGGGGNAVNHMYNQGIADVTFVVCNTDQQDLDKSPVPIKMLLGNETTRKLGAGADPKKGRQAAEESKEDIKRMLLDNTEMVFLAAGMGGGTGTGASPIIAEIAQDMGILTVGIVTIPFAFEGPEKIRQALEGVASLSRYVDAMLVIKNEELRNIYSDLSISNAFQKADDTLCAAAKSIAEIITVTGYINTDFADVNKIMRNGGVAIMNTGYASGENRLTKAIEDALHSPLLNTRDIKGAKRILLSLYCSKDHEIGMDEMQQIHDFMAEVGNDVTVIWGATFDDTLEDQVKVTLIATGFEVKDIPGMPSSILEKYHIIEDEKKEVEFTLTEDEKIEKQKKDADLTRAMEEIYGDAVRSKTKKENLTTISIEDIGEKTTQEDKKSNQTTKKIDIDDLEDDTSKDKEKVPAWKRRLGLG